jgi:hypothetical protein
LPGGAETQRAEPIAVGEALAAFYAGQGLPPDGGSAARGWHITYGPLSLPMPNFHWRRHALPVHDLHHVLTGYPCSPAGEFEMAAWEFAAGRYPHAGATAFCLPLVGLGAVLCPRRTWAAFVRGRASRSLYRVGLTPALLQTPLPALRGRTLPETTPSPGAGDLRAYAALVLVSLAWTAAPLALVAALVAALR